MVDLRDRLIYFLNVAFELSKGALTLLILGTLIHFFLVTIFVISGPSMEPSFHDRQVVLVSRIGLFTSKFRQGDSMVLKFPGDPEHKKYIKRLIALPGEIIQIKNSLVFVNDKKITEGYIMPAGQTFPNVSRKELKEDEYFFLGDNRENSNDSRHWGTAAKRDIVGPVRFIIWPPKDIGYIPVVKY